ncbi:hypothetical protein VNO78_20154 [Psophocarpus tetragonolobus]|uniref:Uncharacterized protein n=1 Tax=Psophocarpus tetragonolobus TaxID=3891 RepID=A0AAN9XGV1_PSOTE
MIPSPFQPNFARLMVMRHTRILVRNRVFLAPPEQSMLMPRPRANSLPYATQQVVAASQPFQGPQLMLPNVAAMEQLLAPPIHEREIEACPIDGTKPYINLLDKPINNEFFNQAIINDEQLDLALRL